MIYFKTEDEVELIRKSNLIVSRTLALVASELKVGVTGKYLDKLAEEFIKDNGGSPAFKNYNGFPASLCISPNEVIVHGIPNDKPFESGDIISIDCGVNLDGFYGDCAYTFLLGEVEDEVVELCRITNEALYRGIRKARPGSRVGDIGYAIQNFTEREHNYSVVRELVGHGVGKQLHESPEIPNFGRKNSGKRLKSGMVIAIEPMINLGKKRVNQADDGWTIFTRDKQPSAHYEHSVSVTDKGPDILSTHDFLEEEIKKNNEVMSFE